MVEHPYFEEGWELEGKITEEIIKEINYLNSNKQRYDEFSKRLKWLIENLLKDQKINFQNILSGVKEKKSILKKIMKKGFKIKDIQDVVRVRIITYLKSDSEKVFELIKKEFDIDESLTRDYSKMLEVDRVGYRSKNLGVRLNSVRKESSEWKNFIDIKFEIQIHTMLENAWSEIQHDRNYKFFGKLPEDFSRKFSLLAGSLELLDSNFDDLCNEVDNYEEKVKQKILSHDLQIEINSLSLGVYLSEKFKLFIGNKLEPKFHKGPASIKMVKDMNILNLKQLDDILKSLPLDEYFKCQTVIAFSDLMRDSLIINFGEKLIDIGQGKDWEFLYKNIYYNEQESDLFRKSGIDLEKLSKKRNLDWSIKDDRALSEHTKI